MVPEAGLEPAQSYDREILSLLCLPIPPLGLRVTMSASKAFIEGNKWRRESESNRR